MTRERKKRNSRRTLLLIWILMALIVILLSIWGMSSFYTWQQYSAALEMGPFQVLVYSPKYLSANEEEKFYLALENTSSNSIEITLRMENDSKTQGFLGLEDSNVIYTGHVQSKEQINRALRVLFYIPPARFYINSTQYSPNLYLIGNFENMLIKRKLDILLAPLPWNRGVSQYSGALLLGLVGLLFRELWGKLSQGVWDEADDIGKEKL